MVVKFKVNFILFFSENCWKSVLFLHLIHSLTLIFGTIDLWRSRGRRVRGGDWVLKFVTCLRILLFLNNTIWFIVRFCGWRGWEIAKLTIFLDAIDVWPITKRSYDVLALQNTIHSVGVIKLWHVFQIYEHDVVHFLIFYEYSSNQDRILTRKAPTPQNPAVADELFWVYFNILGCWDIKG